jgi:hypothetical protein
MIIIIRRNFLNGLSDVVAFPRGLKPISRKGITHKQADDWEEYLKKIFPHG